MKTKIDPARIKALAERSADAYGFNRYASWKACAAALLRRGYTDRQSEEILRSKIVRWAAENNGKLYGKATAKDLLRQMDNYPHDTITVLDRCKPSKRAS